MRNRDVCLLYLLTFVLALLVVDGRSAGETEVLFDGSVVEKWDSARDEALDAGNQL